MDPGDPRVTTSVPEEAQSPGELALVGKANAKEPIKQHTKCPALEAGDPVWGPLCHYLLVHHLPDLRFSHLKTKR